LRYFLIALLAWAAVSSAQDRPTMAGVLDASQDADWRRLDPDDALYMQLSDGLVVFELAPNFAPAHVANIRKLVSNRYFDGLAIIRSQDNYVVQWGDVNAGTDAAQPQGNALASLELESHRSAKGLPFTALVSRDAYADEVGFSDGFPVGRDSADGRAWLTHCYGMLGVGRANSPQSGNGAELYVVTGHAPRHLDRNVTLVGRVVHGIEHLTTLPRGTGPMGFYEDEAEYASIVSIRFGSELAEEARLDVELLRTDTDTFQALIEARRYRAEEWFVDPVERIGLCNVPLPTRPAN
jgi:peptidylprolyl isomerase